jgi:DNA modification methylase
LNGHTNNVYYCYINMMNSRQAFINADSEVYLKKIKSNTISSVITDPPYGIDFLQNEWDKDTGSINVWKECYRVLKPGAHLLAFSSPRTYHRLATALEDIGFEIRDQLMWIKATSPIKCEDLGKKEESLRGWRTQLKAGHEPIVLCRKPLNGTVVENMLEYSTGALNIDSCRIPSEKRICPKVTNSKLTFGTGDTTAEYYLQEYGDRYPMNVIGEFDETIQKYFFCPRVSRKERGEGNDHPTVKPVELMRYLVRLVNKPGAIVIDPFNGSGATGIACLLEGMNYIGIDINAEYVKISKERIKRY